MNELFSTVFKFVVSLILIPVIYAASITFGNHFDKFSGMQEYFFYWGIWFFVIAYLFIHQFKGVQDAGRNVVSSIFGFFTLGKNFFANIIPFYFLALMLGFHVAKNVFGVNNANHYFLFFGGFFIAMHVVCTAADIQSQEKGIVKPNYYFSISLVYLFSVFSVILMIDLVAGHFTFPKYLNGIGKISQDIYMLFLKGLS